MIKASGKGEELAGDGKLRHNIRGRSLLLPQKMPQGGTMSDEPRSGGLDDVYYLLQIGFIVIAVMIIWLYLVKVGK